MIAYLSGTILFNSGTKVILSTPSGIGYEMHLSTSKKVGDLLEVFTYQVIRENAHELFGFKTFEDRVAFEKLISVNGVGPKSAYSLVSTLGVDDLYQAITLEQLDLLKQAPGIGKKAASQIILSLKDKIEKVAVTQIHISGTQTDMPVHLVNESLGALTALGYKEVNVLPVIKKVIGSGDWADSSSLVKEVLKEL